MTLFLKPSVVLECAVAPAFLDVYVGGFDEVIVTPKSGSTVVDKNTVNIIAADTK